MLQLAQTAPEPEKAEAASENVMTVAKDPRYARYLKMVQVVSHYYNLKKKCVLYTICVLCVRVLYTICVLSVTGGSSYGYKE